MIIQGKPELGLQQHQQEAYKSVQKAYEIKDKASVVIPTGCGKSFIALQLMADNKDKRILFMAPTNAIKMQMYNYIAKYIVGEEPSSNRPARMIADEYFPNLKIMLYPSLLRVTDEQMEKLNADIIVMDELHRTGADKWGEKINTLLEQNPNAKILGLTATPDRMDDKNVIDDLFEGNIDYELTLVDALRDGIVKAPTYVKCDYALGEYLDGIRTAISNCNDEQTKKELQDKYDKMRRIVDQADGIPELFAKNIKKKDGKYIIFCKDKAHMDELIDKAKEWFGSIDDNPEIYSVFSGEGYTEKDNRKNIENFENSKSDHLKLLFSIEMLNEGLHVEDISGVIMARPTDSRIIYLQQLGRALSSDTSREKTIVFDLVNNYLKNNLDAEINRKTNSTNRESEENINENDSQPQSSIADIDIFRIQGETKDFLELLNEAQGIIAKSSYLTSARAIKAWIEESGGTKPPSIHSTDKTEKKLGSALGNIRQGLIKPYMKLKAEERKEYRKKHPEIDEVLEIINEIDENNIPTNLVNARAIKEWIEKSGGTKPPAASSTDQTEKRLGTALSSIRQLLIKPYMNLKTEEERKEFKKKHPEIDDVLEIINEIDENNLPPYLVNARAIKEWIAKSGGKKPPASSSTDKTEKRLGYALSSIRQLLIKPYMNLKTEEERKEFRKKHPEIDEVLEIINEIDENNLPTNLVNARKIKEWIEKSGGTKPPAMHSTDKTEKNLGRLLGSIRHYLIKPYIELKTEEEQEAFRKKHPEIDEVLEIINEIDENNLPPYLVNARAIKEWIEKSRKTKFPYKESTDKTEKRLGNVLNNIRQNLIKPYMALKTEEEQEEFRKKRPEIDEVLDIISELDMRCGTKKQKELAVLIRQDLQKRKALQEARKLEQDYEHQLSSKMGEITADTQKQGVDYDEQ